MELETEEYKEAFRCYMLGCATEDQIRLLEKVAEKYECRYSRLLPAKYIYGDYV
jgi:hypothetical protein